MQNSQFDLVRAVGSLRKCITKKIVSVLDMKVATEDICDIYKHAVSKGDKYIECQYYEKSAEKKGFIQYKLLRPIVYVLPHHAPMPVVNMINDMKLTAQEYLFIADSC